jgi:N-dimethylarginine dimethylaminohydrolase
MAQALAWGVSSETAPLSDVLLCRPDHFHWLPANAIARATLRSGVPFDPGAARAQHGELADCLAGAGVACHWLTPDPDLPYQVYTRDSSVVTPWGVIVTQLNRPQRRGEWAAVTDFYAAAGVPIWRKVAAACLEGGDLHLLRPGLLMLGHTGVRTEELAARRCAEWFEAEGWEVRLVPFAEHFLHLDVLFCLAADGLAVACTDVLDDATQAWLEGHGIRLLSVPYREAMQLGCNILALGEERVVSPRGASRLNTALRAEGLTVLDPELDCFTRGGGGVHCLTMPIRRTPA